MSGSASPKLDVTPDWQDHVVDISNGFLIFDDGRCVDPLWGVTIQLSGVPVWVVIAETSDSGLNPQHLFEFTDEYGDVRYCGVFAVFADGSVFTNVTAISNDPYTTLSTLGINDVDALGLFRDDGTINGVIYVAGAQLRVHTFTYVLPAVTTFAVPTGSINPVYDNSTIAVIVNGSVQAFNAYDGTSLRVPSILASGTTSHLHNGNSKQLCAISGNTLYAWNPRSAFGAAYDDWVTMEGTFEAASEFCRAVYPTTNEGIYPSPYIYRKRKVAYLTSNKLYVVDFLGSGITGSSEHDPIIDTYDRSSMPSGVEKLGQIWASYTSEPDWHLRYHAISASGFDYVGLLNPSAIQFSEGVYKRIDITSSNAMDWMKNNDSSDYDPTQMLAGIGRDVYNIPYRAASSTSDCDESQWVKIDVDKNAFKYNALERNIVVGGVSSEKVRYLLVVTLMQLPH